MKSQMKFVFVFLLIITTTHAQKAKSQQVGILLDLQPILQLDMTTPELLNFIFEKKADFQKGIVKKSATILKVSSTVKWDLYAVGRSLGKSPNGNKFWDQEKSFASAMNSVADLPLSLLEIKQHRANSATEGSLATYPDYSTSFANSFTSSAGNSLYVADDGSISPPNKSGKYIAGQSGWTNGEKNDYMPGGSHDANHSSAGNFYYQIDYRILPGYPAIFPNAYSADGSVAENIVANAQSNTLLAGGIATQAAKSFAEPGTYTMYVQYVLLEDQ